MELWELEDPRRPSWMLVSMMLSPERHPTMAGCQNRALRANRASHASHASQEHEPGLTLSCGAHTHLVPRHPAAGYGMCVVLLFSHASRHVLYSLAVPPPGKKSSTGTSSMLISLQDAATRSPPPPSPPPPLHLGPLPVPTSPFASLPTHWISLFSLLPPPSAVCRNRIFNSRRV